MRPWLLLLGLLHVAAYPIGPFLFFSWPRQDPNAAAIRKAQNLQRLDCPGPACQWNLYQLKKGRYILQITNVDSYGSLISDSIPIWAELLDTGDEAVDTPFKFWPITTHDGRRSLHLDFGMHIDLNLATATVIYNDSGVVPDPSNERSHNCVISNAGQGPMATCTALGDTASVTLPMHIPKDDDAHKHSIFTWKVLRRRDSGSIWVHHKVSNQSIRISDTEHGLAIMHLRNEDKNERYC